MESEKKTLEDARNANFLLYLRSRQPDNIYKRWVDAVSAGNTDDAADAARDYRNVMLEQSDNMLVPDRPNVNVPTWETYRQALRDVPEQEGFPLSIVWTEKPL